jgi:hypothetical protein
LGEEKGVVVVGGESRPNFLRIKSSNFKFC